MAVCILCLHFCSYILWKRDETYFVTDLLRIDLMLTYLCHFCHVIGYSTIIKKPIQKPPGYIQHLNSCFDGKCGLVDGVYLISSHLPAQ